MIRVFSSFWNPGQFINLCIESLLEQTVTDWTAHFYDDCSTDESAEIVQKYSANDDRIFISKSKQKKWQSGSLFTFLKENDFAPSDIVVHLDGDDWLPDPEVFSRLLSEYSSRQPILMTYGNFIRFKNGRLGEIGYCSTPEDFSRLRQLRWTTSSLKTQRFGLLKLVNKKDFVGDDGQFLQSAADLAISFPMLEMCGPMHSRCLSSINYVYNMDNPLRTPNVRKLKQIDCAKIIRKRLPYKKLQESEILRIINP